MLDGEASALGRQPRGAVKINGTLIPGWLHFDIHNNNYSSADSFSATFSGTKLPPDRDLNWFSQQQDMYCELFIGFPADPVNFTPADLKSWVYGQVDRIGINVEQRTVAINGRDLTRVFIDAKTTEKWVNKTASQIATLLAQRHGLTAVVGATSIPAGKYYQIDQVQLTHQSTEWDLLSYLAQKEGFLVWVRGQTLYFQPAPSMSSTPVVIKYVPPDDQNGYARGNFTNMQMERALTVSRGIQVLVRSVHSHGKTITGAYPKKSASTIQVGKATAFGGTQTYSFSKPNLTQQQADQFAQSKYQQLIAHEMKIEGLTLPGNNDLDISTLMQLTGTGTAFDQVYFPDSIYREFSLNSSYTMTVNAKNHATTSQVPTL